VPAARTAIFAIALAAGALGQAQAAIRAATPIGTQPSTTGKAPATKQPPVRLCRPHTEYGSATGSRPQSPYAVYVYYVDALCHKTLVRVIRSPQKIVKTAR
jgi:hypothetical protein